MDKYLITDMLELGAIAQDIGQHEGHDFSFLVSTDGGKTEIHVTCLHYRHALTRELIGECIPARSYDRIRRQHLGRYL